MRGKKEERGKGAARSIFFVSYKHKKNLNHTHITHSSLPTHLTFSPVAQKNPLSPHAAAACSARPLRRRLSASPSPSPCLAPSPRSPPLTTSAAARVDRVVAPPSPSTAAAPVGEGPGRRGGASQSHPQTPCSLQLATTWFVPLLGFCRLHDLGEKKFGDRTVLLCSSIIDSSVVYIEYWHAFLIFLI